MSDQQLGFLDTDLYAQSKAMQPSRAAGTGTENCMACLQACANILQHSCVASEGQSGASMWDPSSHRIHSILTGKVCTT